jgi:DNA polymerase-3 subunit alpha
MRVRSVTALNDGMNSAVAEKLWGDILGFAQYSFNKSHAAAYTLISYQAMYLKTNYPLAFYAAAMTMFDEDKLFGLLRDAKDQGVSVVYPDINRSSTRFELNPANNEIIVPFQRIKGISIKTAGAILKAREAGPFTSKADFIARVERRMVNVRVQNALDLVGAFASVEPSQPPANDSTRIKDQVDLLPGLVSAYVPIAREMHRDKTTRDALLDLVDEYRHKYGPGAGDDGMPCKPYMGRAMRIMLVTDAPTSEEDTAGVLGFSRGSASIANAMNDADMSIADVYWTSVVKRPKSGKQVTAEQVAAYKPYLLREIEMLKPTVIVLLGSQAVRSLLPNFKGKASESAGEVIYFNDLDANVVLGFNPGEVYFDPTKQDQMNKIFNVAKELIS